MPSTPPPPDPSSGAPRPGDVLAGKYEVERVIGSGAMGVVVAAMHLDLGERVALKFLLPQAATNAEVVARFAREARASARIKSEHVARVTDVGKLETGEPYMVMEYLEGSDLAGVVQEKGPLPVRDAVEHVIQACSAVAEAHALGIIHRDLKPANLFLANRPGGTPIVKVLDFGISKVLPPRDSAPSFDPSVTRTSAWLGSPLYMSPEQMTSAKNVDAQTDVWSLGAILYELLTAQPPFNADSLPELFAAILNSPPPALEKARPDAPAGLGAVIEKALTRNRDARYANVGELATALVPFAPTRARSAAERAVAVTEAAGLVVTTGTRRPLDSTIGEEVMSPLHDLPSLSQPPPLARSGAGRVSLPTPQPIAQRTQRTEVGTTAVAMASTNAKTLVDTATFPPSAQPAAKRRSGVVLLAAVALVAMGGGFYFMKLRGVVAGSTSASPTPVAEVGTSTASLASAPVSPSPTAPAAILGAAVPIDAGASAPLPVASAIADAGALLDSGAPKLFGRLPSVSGAPSAHGAPSSPNAQPIPVAAAQPIPVPAAPPIAVPTVSPNAPNAPDAPNAPNAPATVAPGALDQQKCFAEMPDGTRKSVPCQ